MELKVGDVVYSKAGHDAKKAYAVVGVGLPKGYVAVADGDKHLLSKPKIKNPKHLRYVGEELSEVTTKLEAGTLQDWDLIYFLKKFRED